MNRRAILAIAGKDIVDAVRNLYVLFGIVFPVATWLLFRLLMPSAADFTLGSLAVFDPGDSRLVVQLSTDPLIERIIKVSSVDELTAVVRSEAVGGLVLPADFDSALAAARAPEVTLLYNGKRGGGELNALRRLVEGELREAAGLPPAFRLVERDAYAGLSAPQGREAGLQTFYLLMLLVMGLAMTGTFVVPTLLVEEKEKHTLKAILAAPASYADVVAGKALVGLFYALLGAVLLLVLNDGLQGDLAPLALGVVLGALTLVEVGLLLGAVCGNAGQVNTWSSVAMLVVIGPSLTVGMQMPEGVLTFMRLLPTYYVTQLIGQSQGLAADTGFAECVAALCAYAAVLFAAIVWFLRREQH
jgi:ABC-2 type transport system permease protein